MRIGSEKEENGKGREGSGIELCVMCRENFSYNRRSRFPGNHFSFSFFFFVLFSF